MLLECPSASVKANREMQLEPRQNNVSSEAVSVSALLRCATVSEPMLLKYSLKSLADNSAGILSNCFREKYFQFNEPVEHVYKYKCAV